jgi:hypothetical protein
MATKAKKKLSNFDFTQKGAAVALVADFQSGPANGCDKALVMKSAIGMNFSKEGLKKMQEIQVTLPVPQFLEKFFGIWGSDAEVLARLMGYVPPEKDEDEEWDYDSWIEEKLSAFTVVKSLQKSTQIDKDLLALSEEEYIAFIEAQSLIEKALKAYEESKSEANATGEDTSVASEVNQEVSTSNVNLEKSMSVKTEAVQKSAEVIELEKALETQKVELQKALDEVAVFKAAAKAAVQKARKEKLQTVIVDAEKAAVVFKALDLLESEEDFNAVVEVLSSMKTAVEKSALFEEQGAGGETKEIVQESPVRKALKAQLAKQAK